MAAVMADGAVLLELPDGAVLFKEGDPPDNLYLVLEGSVAINKCDTTGQSQVIAHIHANDFLGEFAILDGGPRSATVSAAGSVKLAAISRQVILQNLHDANAGLDLTIKIIGRIRASNQRQVEERMRQVRAMQEERDRQRDERGGADPGQGRDAGPAVRHAVRVRDAAART